ncbi:hypothetical protein Tco_0777569 [Tanacetum coccineum]
MHKNKSANRNPANYRLYHALMEALIEDENAMDKEVADTVKDHKRKHDDDDDGDGDDEALKLDQSRARMPITLICQRYELQTKWLKVQYLKKRRGPASTETEWSFLQIGPILKADNNWANAFSKAHKDPDENKLYNKIDVIAHLSDGIVEEHPSETKVFHNEDGNPARANIKQALGSYERSHKGVKASANSDIVYFFTSAQDRDPLQDDKYERLKVIPGEIRINPSLPVPEQVPSLSSGRKRKAQELELEGIFFIDVFGDQAFQRISDIHKADVDTLLSYLMMAINTPENQGFCAVMRSMIESHPDKEKLKSKRVKLEAIGYSLN